MQENDSFPTLPYDAFCYLTRSNLLSFSNIHKAALHHYKGLAEKEGASGGRATLFLLKLRELPSCPGSVLLFPGRWSTFTALDAESLAQEILKGTSLRVFTLRVAHPLTTEETAAELNPHLTGGSSGRTYSG